ncbi:MAG: metal ABC transporter substrate-binding protein [Actinomycetales bacterium]
MPLRTIPLALVVPLSLVLAACGADTSDGAAGQSADTAGEGDRATVAVSFFPIADAARAIAGDAVEVVDLTPPGVSPHDLELTPRTRGDLESADAVIYLGSGFQPQVEQVVDSLDGDVRAVNLLDVVELLAIQPPLAGVGGEVDGEVLPGDLDPHAWVSPQMFTTMVEEITTTLVGLAPDAEADIEAAGADFIAGLDSLDQEFAEGLADCESTVIVTSHRAFEYLARDYGLTQLSIAGITPDEEPDPRTLEAIANAAREKSVTTVFFEDVLPPDLSQTVAEEIGASTDLLSPIETISQEDIDAGATYLSLQRDNLERLSTGLRCGG